MKMLDYLILTVALLNTPSEATTPAPPPAQQEATVEILASGWCPLVDRGEYSFGCDAGVATAIATRKRLSAVAFLGANSLGVGASWTVSRKKPIVALGLGVAAPWDGDGVYLEEWTPVVGATLSFGGKR